MPVPTFTVELTSCDPIARDVYALRFQKPAGFSFKAGQFILFDVPLTDDPADVQPRAYSIASAPSEQDLFFIIKLVPNGRMSRWILHAKSGMTLTMKGPFGIFVIDPTSTKHLVLAGTSTGIAPFRSQIITLQELGDMRPIDLFLGVHSEEDLFWQTELDDLAKRHPHIRIHRALTTPSASWKGLQGRLQAVIPQVITDFSGVQLYLCGNPGMVKETKALALTTWTLQKVDVKIESYI